ncbi:MAG TPA: hypothetical protein VIH17_05935, partial [Candidatus Acidoferrales bacterium]
LVVGTFLATMAIDITPVDRLPVFIERLPLANDFLWAIGTGLLVGELWPRKYRLEDCDYWSELKDYLISNSGTLDSSVREPIVERNASLAMGRIQHN